MASPVPARTFTLVRERRDARGNQAQKGVQSAPVMSASVTRARAAVAGENFVFDHLCPDEKRAEVSRMAQQIYGLSSVKAGVAKCRVLCVDHHQKHTVRQFGYRK